MSRVNDILKERQSTHGCFATGAEIMQRLKFTARNTPSYQDKLSDSQREAVDMILHKVGRILNGNPNEPDHWNDIAGYATLVADELEAPSTTIRVNGMDGAGSIFDGLNAILTGSVGSKHEAN